MKYFLFVIMYLLVISVYGSAQRRIIPFKNVYENYPDTIQSNLSFDDTWDAFDHMIHKGSDYYPVFYLDGKKKNSYRYLVDFGNAVLAKEILIE
jgi:hypothetical protein